MAKEKQLIGWLPNAGKVKALAARISNYTNEKPMTHREELEISIALEDYAELLTNLRNIKLIDVVG